MSDVKTLAMNKWPSILEAAGIGSDFLRNVHGPCPVCGGKDRFRFDDLEGTGSYFCNNPHHGAGDGIKLLMTYRDCSFKEAAQFIEEHLGHMPVKAIHRQQQPVVNKKRDEAKVRAGLQKVAHACFRVTRGDAVWKYLMGTRGLELSEIPRAIKIHPRLGYYERDTKGEKMVKVGEFPAMIAVISGPDGAPVSLHRTYLTMSGSKAPVKEPKKVMSMLNSEGKTGGAIRLYPAGKVLAVAEGVETALAVHKLTGYPVWATISASWMKSLVIPGYVEKVIVFADNDAPDHHGVRAGQEAAESLKTRLESEGKEVTVVFPKQEGADFADVWYERVVKGQQIAA